MSMTIFHTRINLTIAKLNDPIIIDQHLPVT